MNKVVLWVIAFAALFGVLIFIAKPKMVAETTSKLSAEHSTYDFGEISMQDGKVKHTFQVKNGSENPVTITKLYTSCMCTTTELTAGDQQAGPFGMQGHGNSIPDIAIGLQPGETANIEVVFDPAAHGSSGVGEINRSVFVAEGNSKFELTFKAVVRP